MRLLERIHDLAPRAPSIGIGLMQRKASRELGLLRLRQRLCFMRETVPQVLRQLDTLLWRQVTEIKSWRDHGRILVGFSWYGKDQGCTTRANNPGSSSRNGSGASVGAHAISDRQITGDTASGIHCSTSWASRSTIQYSTPRRW